MVNPKGIVKAVKKIDVKPAEIVKKVSVAAVVGVAEGGKVVADMAHDMKIKRRDDAIAYLDKLEELKQKGIITQEEFEKKRAKIIKKI